VPLGRSGTVPSLVTGVDVLAVPFYDWILRSYTTQYPGRRVTDVSVEEEGEDIGQDYLYRA